ncbi:MAG TPA: isoprenylcysteine carboxylmethyltransferase family protein [Candidatus Acidoferrales bacterium]|jgi:protein-S-isoprenylcysteine O-methyltransferase Ste14
MITPFDGLAAAVVFAVAACWIGFGVVFLTGKAAGAKTDRKRDIKSILGMAVQGVGYAIVFIATRARYSALAPMPKWAEGLLGMLAIAIAVVSVGFSFVAVRTLGRQWALVARVTEGHELITRGPYAVVRNPIYLAMLGMLVASGLAISRWEAVVAAVIIFLLGTAIRIRTEENLLRSAFGETFADYTRRVPSLFPKIF